MTSLTGLDEFELHEDTAGDPKLAPESWAQLLSRASANLIDIHLRLWRKRSMFYEDYESRSPRRVRLTDRAERRRSSFRSPGRIRIRSRQRSFSGSHLSRTATSLDGEDRRLQLYRDPSNYEEQTSGPRRPLSRRQVRSPSPPVPNTTIHRTSRSRPASTTGSR